MSENLRIGLCVFGLCVAFNSTFAQTGTHDDFELVRADENIRVYERWVTFPESDPPVTAREVKSEFYVRGKIADALSLIRDESQIGAWQKHVSEFSVYPQSDSVWFEYSYHDIPWPVSDQDHFLEYKVQDPPVANGTFVTFQSVANKTLAPDRKGASRMTLAGSWYFEKTPQGTIRITYRILSMPGNLPRFVTDPVIRNNLMSTVKSYIGIMESGYKRPHEMSR
jgi:hypothetical protein